MKISKKRVKQIFLSLLAGVIVGIIFKILRFPLPAPPNMPAFMGIFGVWLGAAAIEYFDKRKSGGK